jgi:hypothetical protein
MAGICLVHLVWKPLGVEPMRRFLDSYRQRGCGQEHRLVMLFHGFGGEGELGPWLAELEGVAHECLLTEGPSHDIPAYLWAARRIDGEYLSFVNSHSVILDGEWLAKLYAHARREGVGAAGATGSWASHSSYTLFEMGKPSPYADIMADVKRHLPERHPNRFALAESLEEAIRTAALPRRLALRFYYYGLVASYHRAFNGVRNRLEDRRRWRSLNPAEYPPFPAYHLRTNAFMIRRETMLGLKTWEMKGKEDSLKFESGRESMTYQLLRAGLKVLVVGRDGRGYEKEEWARSETFWQGAQRNLLVADNQTRDYEEGNALRRLYLSRSAWGEQAAPALPHGETRLSA